MRINGNLVFNDDQSGQIGNVYLDRRASAPAFNSLEVGRVYFNTTTTRYYFNDGIAWTEFGSGSGGSSFLAQLDDVSLTSSTNLQVLQYDGTSSLWKNHTLVLADISNSAVSQGSGGTFRKITVDGYGRVVANTAVVAGDITTLVNGAYVNVSGDSMNSGASLSFSGGGTVTGLPTPIDLTDATNKAYVDSIANGLSWKQAVRVGTVANINLSSALVDGAVVNGVTLTVGDRVLVKSQTNPAQNGIYVTAISGAASRSADMNNASEFAGAAVFAIEGAAEAGISWTETSTVNVVGTDPVIFSRFTPTSSDAAAGSDTQIQFNNSGSFDGDADLTWNSTSNLLTVGSILTGGTISNGSNQTALTLKGGDGTDGGGIVVRGGTASLNSGGTVSIQGSDGAGTGNGGNVNILAGNKSNTAVGNAGAVTIKGGGTFSPLSPGGVVTISAGDSSHTSAGGVLTLRGGDAITANGQSGGAVVLRGGDVGSGGTGAGGNVTIAGGLPNSGSAGSIFLQTNAISRLTIDGAGVLTVGTIAAPGSIVSASATGTTAGAPLNIRGGDGGPTSGAGGNVTIGGGNSAGASGVNTTGQGGSTFIVAGNSASTSSTSLGGPIGITAGSAGPTGTGGAVTISGGQGGSTSGAGGDVVVQGGVPPTSGRGGSVTVRGRDAAGTGTAGGNILVGAGNGNSGAGGNGGSVSIFAGRGGTTGIAGTVLIQGGAGGFTTGAGGSVSIAGGTTNSGVGGAVTISGAAGGGTNFAGGALSLKSGNGTGSASGGAIDVTGGVGGTTGTGGLVTISAGQGGTTSGAGGNTVVTSGTPIDGAGGSVSIIAQPGASTGATARNGGSVLITAGNQVNSGTPGDIRFATLADGAGSGTDRLVIKGNGSWQLASDAGVSGYVLTSTGPSGAPTWQAPGTFLSFNVTTFTKTIVFGSSTTNTLFTLPANYVVHEVKVILDTPFNGAVPTITIGVSGSTSKYMAATQNNLKGTATDVYVADNGNAPVGTPENLEAYFTPSGSTIGSARILIFYSFPQT